MMLTDRGIGLAGGAGALWLTSRGFGVPELQMVAVAALALLATTIAFVRTTSGRLVVERDLRPGRLFHDGEAHVNLTIRNHSRLPTAGVELEDAVPPALASRGPRLLLAPVPPHATRAMHYVLRGHHRGRFTIGPLTARLRDPFGLVARRVELPATSELVVYPRVWTLPRGVPLGGTSAGGGGQTRPRPSGEDLAHVREYVRGDDLRKVHWPSTAHRGRLMIRQPESPQDPRATVLLDVREQAHRGAGPSSSLETAVSAAASVVHHLAIHGRAVTLVDRPIATTPPTRPWPAWLAQLAELRAARVDLMALLRQLGQGLTGDGLVVAVLPVPGPGELRALVRAGRRFSSRLAVLVDTHTHAGRGQQTGHAGATADALRLAGWRVTVVGPRDRLDERWRDLMLHTDRVPAGVGR